MTGGNGILVRWGRIVPLWSNLVAFPHTVFAFPFAISMMLVVARHQRLTLDQFWLIVVALVAARTAAMAFNRIIDRDIDARNPRTKNRELVSGKLPLNGAKFLLILCSVGFIAAAAGLGNHCLVLSPLVLLILFLYSLTKRFTQFSHVVLGLALSLAPGGVWYALTAEFSWQPTLMMLAVLFWVAGFDIIYYCQDVDFDRQEKLHSMPSKLGITKALCLAKVLHVFSILILFFFAIVMQVGLFHYLGILLFAALLFSQHLIVSPKNLSRVDAAFFTRNGLASIIYLIGVAMDFGEHDLGSD